MTTHDGSLSKLFDDVFGAMVVERCDTPDFIAELERRFTERVRIDFIEAVTDDEHKTITAVALPPADFDDSQLASWQRHAIMLLCAEATDAS